MDPRWMVEGAELLEKALPGFSPLRLGLVERLEVRSYDDRYPTAYLHVRYAASSALELVLALELVEVRQMRIPELGPWAFELNELEITDVSDRGLEGILREVQDHSRGR